MLEIDFVEDLPVIDLVMVAGLVPDAVFILKATQRVPAYQARVIVGQFLHAGIAQFRPLGVIPLTWSGSAG